MLLPKHKYLPMYNMKKYKNNYRLDPLDQIDGILSGIKYNKTSGKVIRASAFLNIWLLKQNGTKDPNGELIDAVAMEWEKVFIEEIIVKEKNMGNQEDLTINGFTDRRYAKYLKIQIKEGKYLIYVVGSIENVTQVNITFFIFIALLETQAKK